MARLTGRSVFDLLEDYRQLIEAAENVPIDHKRLRAYQRFLQREAHRLERDPDALLPLAWNAPLDHPVHQDAENSSLRPAGPWLRRLNPPQQDLIRAIHNEHEGRVTALALSAKSHRAVSADSAKLIWWDIETGRTKILTEFSGSVFTKVSISSDGRRVVVLVDDGSAPHGASYGAVICCDSERGVIRHVSASSDSHSSVGCSCSGRFAVLGYPDGTLVYWDCWIDDQQPKKLVLKAHMAEVRDVSLSADGQRLVSMDQSGKVFLWDLEEHDEPRELSGFGSLKSVAISSDGSSVVLLDCDGYLTQADTATTSEICRTRLFDKPDFASVSFRVPFGAPSPKMPRGALSYIRAISSDGGRVLLDDHDYGFVWCDIKAGKTVDLNLDRCLRNMSLSADGRVVLWSTRHRLWRWDCEADKTQYLIGPSRPVSCIALSKDGRSAASGEDDGTVVCWDLELADAQVTHEQDLLEFASLASDGRRVVSGGGDNPTPPSPLISWNSDTGEAERVDGFSYRVACVSISGDGRRAVAAAAGVPHAVICWDIYPGKRKVFNVPPSWNLVDNNRRLTVLKGKIPRLPATAGSKQYTRSVFCVGVENSPVSVALSRNGKCGVAACEKDLVLWWDTDTGQRQTLQVPPAASLSCVSLASHGNGVVGGTADGLLIWWNIVTCERRILEGQSVPVHSVSLAGDGLTSVSGRADGTLILWNVKRESVDILEAHDAEVDSVAISSGGTRAVSADSDATLICWDLHEKRPLTQFSWEAPILAVAWADDAPIVSICDVLGTVARFRVEE